MAGKGITEAAHPSVYQIEMYPGNYRRFRNRGYVSLAFIRQLFAKQAEA